MVVGGYGRLVQTKSRKTLLEETILRLAPRSNFFFFCLAVIGQLLDGGGQKCWTWAVHRLPLSAATDVGRNGGLLATGDDSCQPQTWLTDHPSFRFTTSDSSTSPVLLHIICALYNLTRSSLWYFLPLYQL